MDEVSSYLVKYFWVAMDTGDQESVSTVTQLKQKEIVL